MDELEVLGHLLAEDRWRMGVLRLVCDLDIPESFVTGDFVRHLVWDHLHGRPMTPLETVEVVYWAPERAEALVDRNLEGELSVRSPKKNWSVFNLARLSPRPDDIEAALRRGPETASAVAVAVDHHDRLSVRAPFGLSDLFDGIVRPVDPSVADEVRNRVVEKRWRKLYPRLKEAL